MSTLGKFAFVAALLFLVQGTAAAQGMAAQVGLGSDQPAYQVPNITSDVVDARVKEAREVSYACDDEWRELRAKAAQSGAPAIEEALWNEIDGRNYCAGRIDALHYDLTAHEAEHINGLVRFQYAVRDWAKRELVNRLAARGEDFGDIYGRRMFQPKFMSRMQRDELRAKQQVERAEVQRKAAADAIRDQQAAVALEANRKRLQKLQDQEDRRERKHRESNRDSSGVHCCDGTESPTCTYAHRGCCSHHGGVCD